LTNKLEFLKKQAPICSKFPLYHTADLSDGLYYELAKRSMTDFNENLLARRCSKADFCGSECLGRPIPMYPELRASASLLDGLEVGLYKGKEVWLLKATQCNTCPFKNSCDSMCGTMSDFLDKDLPQTAPSPDRTQEYFEEMVYEEAEVSTWKTKYTRDDIPWNILNEQQRKIVELRTLYFKDWNDIALEVGITRQVCSKIFKRAIRKLKKSGQLMKAKNDNEISNDYHISGMSVKELAEKYGIGERTVYNYLKLKGK